MAVSTNGALAHPTLFQSAPSDGLVLRGTRRKNSCRGFRQPIHPMEVCNRDSGHRSHTATAVIILLPQSSYCLCSHAAMPPTTVVTLPPQSYCFRSHHTASAVILPPQSLHCHRSHYTASLRCHMLVTVRNRRIRQGASVVQLIKGSPKTSLRRTPSRNIAVPTGSSQHYGRLSSTQISSSSSSSGLCLVGTDYA